MMQYSTNHWQDKSLGRYKLLHLVGKGGMGEVWLAEDPQLRRQVAVKILPPVMAADQHYLQSFEHEARTAAALEHPHILSVHDFGQQTIENASIATYLVTPYISGGSLRDRIRSSKGVMPPEESLHYLEQAALAIDYAHSRQVIHRDIKPGNMLLQERWLLLSDFGIAKLLQTTIGQSRTNAGAGTPEYMAPEQIQGHAIPASDLYSLAIIAYQLFTGSVPFKGENYLDTMMHQINTPYPSVKGINPQIPSEVDVILARGLAKRPEERPATCIEFVTLLAKAWNIRRSDSLDPDATVLAPWNKNARQQQNIPFNDANAMPPFTPAFTASPGETTMNQGTPQALWQSGQSALSEAPTRLSAAAEAAHAATQIYDQSGQMMQPPEASQAPESTEKKGISRRALLIGGVTVGTLAVLGAAGTVGASYILNSSPQAGPQKLVEGTAIFQLRKHLKPVYDAVWDPQSRYVLTTGEDNAVYMWDIATVVSKLAKNAQRQNLTQPLNSWQFNDYVDGNQASWSADSKSILVVPQVSDTIYLLNAMQQNAPKQTYTEKKPDDFLHFYSYNNVAWKPDSNDTFAVTTFPDTDETRCVSIWQVTNHSTPVKNLSYTNDKKALHRAIVGIRWSKSGKYLAGTPDGLKDGGRTVVWDSSGGAIVNMITWPKRAFNPYMHEFSVDTIWSPLDEERVAIINSDAGHVLDVLKNKILFSLGTDDRRPHNPPDSKLRKNWVAMLNGLAWSPNGKYIAGCYSNDNRVYIWDAQEQSSSRVKDGLRMPIMQFGDKQGHTYATTDLSWSPDGKYIATTSFDNTVIIWKVDAEA